MNKINLLLLTLISVSLHAKPSKMDYALAWFYPGAYVRNKQAREYKKIANEFAYKQLNGHKISFDKIRFIANLGPAMEGERLKIDLSTDDPLCGYAPKSNASVEWQALIGKSKQKSILDVTVNQNNKNSKDQETELRIQVPHCFESDIKSEDLKAFTNYHKDFATKLVSANWSGEVEELIHDAFFKLIDKQGGIQDPDKHVADLITSHENAVLKAAFQTKMVIGALALATAIGFSIKPLKKKLEKKQNDNQAAQPAA